MARPRPIRVSPVNSFDRYNPFNLLSRSGSCDNVTPVNSRFSWISAFTPGGLIGLISAILFVLYPGVMLGTQSFFDRDFGLFTYPIAHYTREQLLHGHVPLWNPLNDCGVPFLAQWNTGVCYPLSIFYVLFPLPWSLNYFCLGHLLLAGLGMYLLARDWTGNSFAASVAGLAYAVNGLSLNCLMWTSNLAALAWFPLVVLFVQRAWTKGGRGLLAAIVAGAMQTLAGAPEIVLLTWLVLASLWCMENCGFGFRVPRGIPSLDQFERFQSPMIRRSQTLRRLAVIGLLILGLCAIQLLPFFQLLANSDRTGSEANAAWALPRSGLGNFLVPLFHCEKTILGPYIQVDQQWTSSYYVGIGTLTLALVAALKTRSLRVWWLVLLTICGSLLALGNSGFVYPLLTRLVPLFGFIRYPIKFIALTIFALPLLAAYGIAAITEWDRRTASKNIALAGGIVAALTVAVLTIARFFPAPNEVWSATFTSGITRLLLLLTIMGALVYMQRINAPRTNAPMTLASSRLAAFVVLVALGIDGITHSPHQILTVPNVAYGDFVYSMSAVPRLGESRAMVSPQAQAVLDRASLPDACNYYLGHRKALFQNCNLIDNIPKINGFSSLHLRDYNAIKEIIYQPTNYPAGLIDFLGANQLTSDDNFWKWVSRPSALPMITGGQRVVFGDTGRTLAALQNGVFAPRDIVYLEKSAAGAVTATNPAPVHIVQKSFSAQRIEAEVSTESAGIVVISQNHYPAWKAFVDGKPTPLFRANHAFQAVQIPSGTHQISLIYKDTFFNIGALISGCSILVCALMWARLVRV